MVRSTVLPQRKSSQIYLCTFILLALGFYTRHKTGFKITFSEANKANTEVPYNKVISFLESEIIENNNSTPPTGVLMGRYGGYGLGNHLFFYAESYTLSRNLGIPLLLPLPPEEHEDNLQNFTDRGFVLDHFSLPKGTYLDQTGIEGVYSATCEMAENVSLIPEEIKNNTKYFKIGIFCFNGQFFEEYKEELQQIKVKVHNPSEAYTKWDDLISETEWPIAVHVRRGDLEDHYWSAPADYFQEALRRMKQEIPSELQKKAVFVFSDEMVWAKENIIGEGFFAAELGWPIYFVSGSFGGLTNLEELDLMIKCKSIVISNSTFSWWAAYLMKDNDKMKKIVIRPEFNATKHQNDHLGLNNKTLVNYAISYPREWITIDT